MDGFIPITPATLYSKGRGYGLKDARIWRAFDALQPDPLYQDFICIEGGGLAVDVPNGKYRVFVNIDSPSGFWGEYQTYRTRAVLAEGRPVVERDDGLRGLQGEVFPLLGRRGPARRRHVRQVSEALFPREALRCPGGRRPVEPRVPGRELGVLRLGRGDLPRWRRRPAARRSSIMCRPGAASTSTTISSASCTGRPAIRCGRPTTTGAGAMSSSSATHAGRLPNDTPFEAERADRCVAEAFAGEYEPVTLGLVPLRDLGKVAVEVSDLTGPGGTIPSRAIDLGFVSNRISRVTVEGTVYTISPRLIMPGGVADVPEGLTRRFWMTVRTPADARPGVYKGTVTIRPEKGALGADPDGIPRPRRDARPGGHPRRPVRLLRSASPGTATIPAPPSSTGG